MAEVRGIVFDKDGTLFDFQSTWAEATARLLAELSRGDPALLDALSEAAGFDRASRLLLPHSVILANTLPEAADALLQALPKGTSQAFVVETMIRTADGVPQVEVVPLIPYFEALGQRGLRLGIATNDAEAPARKHLNEAGIAAAFHFVAGYDSGHGAKPGPGQLVAFCAETGLHPSEVVMVGDSRHDLTAGRAAGMSAVGVLTGAATKGDLAPHADVVLDHIGHLPDWLDSL